MPRPRPFVAVAALTTALLLAGSAQHSSVVGMAQGKRAVLRDAASGRWLVHVPNRAGATFVRPGPAAPPSPVFDIHPRPLEELRAEVKSFAAASGKAP